MATATKTETVTLVLTIEEARVTRRWLYVYLDGEDRVFRDLALGVQVALAGAIDPF